MLNQCLICCRLVIGDLKITYQLEDLWTGSTESDPG
jgi:hypothetical protein